MSSERHDLIKDLLVRISEVPEDERRGFLDKVCSGDARLRDDVDALLKYEATARALDLSALGPGIGPKTLDPLGFVGQTISHYRVLELIGRGGMGVVYKAEDLRLRRTVALKFLPPHLILDDRANRRFMHEAQAASALDHPNICTIFDIDRTEDAQLFIAMGYYDGPSLAQLIRTGPIEIDNATSLVSQALRGLAVAHGANIVHRDVKPANLLLAGNGLVKIVDFGLAKLAGETRLTRADAKIGTVAYMSPEQLEGREADSRSDIWAIGVTLYELLTGSLPFRGDEAATAHSIQNRDPGSVRSLRPDAPRSLDTVLRRAIAKHQDDRYQSAEEFLADLPPLGEETGPRRVRRSRSMAPASLRRRWLPRSRLRSLRRAAGIVVAAAVVIAGFAMVRRLRPSDPLPRFTNATQITSEMGVELFPTWAPDGQSLAYQSARSGNWDVWVAQIGVGKVNRTAGHDGYDGQPSWSPDGAQIAFVSEREGGGTFVVPAIGGTPRKVSELQTRFLNSPQWSPDGTEIAFLPSDTSRTIEFVDVRTNEVRRVSMPEEQNLVTSQLSWSPSGRFIAYVNSPDIGALNSRLWILDLDQGAGYPVTEPGPYDFDPSWSADERTLYFLSNRGGSRDLWRMPLGESGHPSGAAEALTNGLGLRDARLTPDGSRIAYCRGTPHGGTSNIWRFPIFEDRASINTDASQLTFDEATVGGIDLSPDGTRILFDSSQGGNRDIWSQSVEGGPGMKVVAHPAWDGHPRWSPDGQEFVFISDRRGSRDIWISPATGGEARQVTNDSATDSDPDWSPDGKWIVFVSNRSGNDDLWVVAASGGEARQVTDDEASDWHPDWSPDGEWILFTSARSSLYGEIWRIPAIGGEAELVTLGGYCPRYSPDGSKAYFKGSGERGDRIWEYSFVDGSQRAVVNVGRRQGIAVCQANDGRDLYLVWSEAPRGDIWVMDVQ